MTAQPMNCRPRMVDLNDAAQITQRRVYSQLSPAELVEHALARKEGVLSETGALVVDSAPYTGRSPHDRFIVQDSVSFASHIDWGDVNRPITREVFDRVKAKMMAYLRERDIFVFDGFAGANERHRLAVRFINELASQNLFVHQLFIRPNAVELARFQPQFTVMCAPGLKLDPDVDGVHSEAAVLVCFEERLILVSATRYSGEMKKSIFSVMNYLLPEDHVLPMHCSANVGVDGRSALFFGLSGTGKTTLSADPDRRLIGDDEHGWCDDGIFNMEGGCYAKTIRLNKDHEPDIWNAIRFGALVENVTLDPHTRIFDFDDDSTTENGRVGYPIHHIPNAERTGVGPHPSAIIFLTADAFGVLPAVAKLTPEQAQYHFLSGYTSKLAGTECGIKEPKAVFSCCFGAPFMPRPAHEYAQLLKERIEKHHVQVYLINTGWQGGGVSTGGKRLSIPNTRALVSAALNGSLDHVAYRHDDLLNLDIPLTCPDVPAKVLDPRSQWADTSAYDAMARKLATMFAENFRKHPDAQHLAKVGPQPEAALCAV
jgi:phosphoenolpyruvate carboxykinase (ATP)